MSTHLTADPTATGAAVFPARPEWLTLSAALADEVPVIADREDLLVSIAPGAGGGAPACFYPARALIEVDGNHLRVDPATVNPANLSDRPRYAATWGALTHECGHAKHTVWEPPKDTPRGVVAAAMLLEEPRMEAAQVRRRPDDRHWLRACAKDIVAADLHLFADPTRAPKMTKPDAAHTAALLLGRVDGGILTRASLRLPLGPEDLWRRIFPAEVDGEDIGSLLVSHTLLRPRDMIHLCNLCRDTAAQNGHSRIHPADVREAIIRYSRWKLDDLSSEYLINYPYLGGLLAMFRDSGYLVGRGAFEKRYKASLEELRNRFPDRAYGLTPNAVLDVLYHVGFLGVQRNGRVVYSHEQEDRVEPTDEAFAIHPSFRHALRADTPTLTHPPEWSVVSNVVQAANVDQVVVISPRSNVAFELFALADTRAQRLLNELPNSHLPKEIRQEIFETLQGVRDRTSALQAKIPSTREAVLILEQKHLEARQAAKLLGVAEYRQHDLPDMRLDTVPHVEVNQLIEDAIAELEPTVVYSVHPDVNLDHQAVFRSAMVATRPRAGSPVRRVLTYAPRSSVEWTPPFDATFMPTWFADISETLETKVAAFQCYATETREWPHPRSARAIRAAAATWGSGVGWDAAEPFVLVRQLHR